MTWNYSPEAVTIDASPADASIIWHRFAERSPRMVPMVFFGPYFMLLAVANNTLGPGVTAKTSAVAANEAHKVKSIVF